MREQRAEALDEAREQEACLQAQYPGWRVWRTSRTWWATRSGPLWRSEPRTLAADTADALSVELRKVRDA